MDMLSGEQISAAALTDWRKLGQGCTPDSSSATLAQVSVSSPPSARPGKPPGIIPRFGWARLT